MLVDHLPVFVVVVPLMAAPLCVLLRDRLLAWLVALVANSVAVYAAWSLLQQVSDGSVLRYSLGGWAAPTGIEYVVDTLNASIALIVSLVSLIVLFYASASAAKEIPSDKHYLMYTAWLLCLCGLLGIVLTGDAFNVFVFLEISSLSTYMLISLGRERNAFTAAFRYLVMGSIGASFILIGIGFLYAATGTLNMLDLAERIPAAESSRTVLIAFSFLTVGLMIKAAVFPLHAWLANAYHYAPSAVAAFIAGTATKVSLYVLLRFFFTVFGAEYSFGEMLLTRVLLPAAVIGYVLMSLVAVFQTDLRRMLAYSSIAQIGYILAGISMASITGLTAGIVHIFNHALIKAALFMAVGCIVYRVGHAHISSLPNLVRSMPITVCAFIVAGFSLIGVPLTAGFISKFTLINGALERGWWLVVISVLLSSIFAIVYISRAAEVMLFRRARHPEPTPAGFNEAPLSMLVPLWIMIGISLVAGINGSLTLKIASAAAAQLLGLTP